MLMGIFFYDDKFCCVNKNENCEYIFIISLTLVVQHFDKWVLIVYHVLKGMVLNYRFFLVMLLNLCQLLSLILSIYIHFFDCFVPIFLVNCSHQYQCVFYRNFCLLGADTKWELDIFHDFFHSLDLILVGLNFC